MRLRSFAVVGPWLVLWVLWGATRVWAAEAPVEHPVVLLPLGKVRPEFLERISQEIQSRMNVSVRVDPPQELPPEAYYAPRRRWRAERILAWMQKNPPPGAWKVIAVTEAQISTTKGAIADWGIAGLGLIDGRSCVVSAYIYMKHSRTKAALLRRLGDLAIHEYGHTLGLDHCDVKGCVMSDAKGKALQSADQSSGHFCARCLGLLSPEVRALMK